MEHSFLRIVNKHVHVKLALAEYGLINENQEYQMWLVIIMMRLILNINYYWPADTLQSFLKLLNLSANKKLFKIQLSKVVQSGGLIPKK